MAKSKESKSEKKMPERAKIEDVESIVIDLAKKGNSPSKIGIILKEKYGIYNIKALGKRISRILNENKIEYMDDFQFVDKKIKNMENHFSKNHQDKRAEREIVKYISLRKKLQSSK